MCPVRCNNRIRQHHAGAAGWRLFLCPRQAEDYLKAVNSIPANDTLPGNLADLVPATAEQFAYMQWADCSILNVVRPRAGRPALWVCWPATSARGRASSGQRCRRPACRLWSAMPPDG